jgi:hypothetical protein
LACAALLKYTAVLFSVPVLAALRHGRRARQAARAAFWVAGGLVTGALLFILKLWFDGSLDAFVYHHTEVLPAYVRRASSMPGPTGFALFHRELMSRPALPWLVGASALALLGTAVCTRISCSEYRRAGELSALALTVAAVGTFVQGRFFEYQFLPWLGPTSIGLGVMYALVEKRASELGVRAAQLVRLASYALAVAAGLHSPLTTHMERGWNVLAGVIDIGDYWRSGWFELQPFSLRNDLLVADYLRSPAAPPGKVLYWGLSPLCLFAAGRESASRHIYNYAFTLRDVHPMDRQRLLADLQASKPSIILVSSKDATPWVNGTDLDSLAAFQRETLLVRWVNEHYRPYAQLGRYSVLHLRE